MYEANSIHYYSIGYPATSITKRSIRECIAYNKKLRDKRGLIWDGGFNCHSMDRLLEYIKNEGYKKIYYYYHTYDIQNKSDEAKVFINYAELDDAINKDLEEYEKTKPTFVQDPELTPASPSVTIGNTISSGNVSRNNTGNAVTVGGIQAGTIGIQGPTREQTYVDGTQGIDTPAFNPQYGMYDGAIMPTATAARTEPYGSGVARNYRRQIEILQRAYQEHAEEINDELIIRPTLNF